MSLRKLPNYLRTHRKRLGLSQDQAAFLLGVSSSAKISRYESFTRVPNLETALALEAIYQKPVSELFAGLYEEVQRKVAGRTRTLMREEPGGTDGPQTDHHRVAPLTIIPQQNLNDKN